MTFTHLCPAFRRCSASSLAFSASAISKVFGWRGLILPIALNAVRFWAKVLESILSISLIGT